MQITRSPANNNQEDLMQLPEVPTPSLSKMAALVRIVFSLFIFTQIICHLSEAHQLNIMISNTTTPEVVHQYPRAQPAVGVVNFSVLNPLDLEPIIQTISTVNEEAKPAAAASIQRVNELASTRIDETTTKKNSDFVNSSNETTSLDKHTEQPTERSDFTGEDSNDLSDYNDLIEIHQKTSNIKNRRQADNYLDGNDWWTKLINMPEGHAPKAERVFKRNSASDLGGRESYFGEDQPYKRVVYQEQPVTQNPIITVKNQLATIESQRKLLISRSIKQLYQLDTRLIDSYKTYMKKKQPLYAGMLYSTRGFVIKMAKEVKQSKNVLDSMSKQVQGVLKQRMANRTLVKEYSKLIGAPDDAVVLLDESRSLRNEPVSPGFRVGRTLSSFNTGSNEVYQAPRKTRIRYTISVHEVNFKKQLAKIQSLVDRINGSTYELNMVINDINYLFKIAVREVPRKVIPTQPPVKEMPKKENISPIKTTKFIQELDKHSPSTYNSKLGRKAVKSPIKIFMEKYGKLKYEHVNATATNHATSSELVESSRSNTENLYTSDLPEMQPLFDASSFVYTEPKDLSDIGFNLTNGVANKTEN